MKIRMTLGAFVLGVGATLLTSMALSQDKGGKPSQDGAGTGDMSKMMEKWMESMKPGRHHKALEKFVGTWDTTTRMWMAGPGTPPTETHGVSERRFVLDGRFVLDDYKSEMAMPDMTTGAMKKLPWNGVGLLGYDNIRNLYVECWTDTTATDIKTMKGAMDPSGNTLTLYGEMDEPMLNVYGRLVKYRTRLVDADTQVFEITDLAAGDDYKVVEVTYKRRK